jgi:putative hemolysin
MDVKMDESSVRKPAKFIDIDRVFYQKNPKLYKLIPTFFLSFLKRIVHQEGINEFIEANHDKNGMAFSQAIVDKFAGHVIVKGLEDLPKDQRYIFASNHPLGGLDGMVFLSTVGKLFPKVLFPVNDILMSLDNLRAYFVPINKHGAQGREAARLLEQAYASDNQILMFPAGLVSRKIKGKIVDLEWKRNFVKKAIQHQRDIVPVHISGRNTNFFYNLANWRKRLGIKVNIEMLFLPDELFKSSNKDITISFGQPIHWQDLKQSHKPNVWAQKIKEETYRLEKSLNL